jgi:hypothetical protein
MNTATAASTANVTVATIRTWCRNGVITATKQAGRWIIDAASLAWRIALATIKTRREAGMDRDTYETETRKIGYTPMKDGGCRQVYLEHQAFGTTPSNPLAKLHYTRGAAVEAAGYVQPKHQPHAHECHFCGLDARTCDCR